MTRERTIVGILVGLMLAVGSIPAGAGNSSIPKTPNVVDIAGDANGLVYVDVATPVQIPEADVLEAWFTNDRRSITAHWHLSAAPQKGDSIQLVMHANPNSSDVYPEVPRISYKSRCLFFSVAFRTDDLQASDPYTAFTDQCMRGPDLLKWFIGAPVVAELEDGTAIVSARFPRSESPALKGGSILTSIRARTANADWVLQQRPAAKGFDSTDIGRDYKLR